MHDLVRHNRNKKPASINKKWAKKVSFSEFKKNADIAKLNEKEQIALYELHSGKKVKTEKVKIKKEEE